VKFADVSGNRTGWNLSVEEYTKQGTISDHYLNASPFDREKRSKLIFNHCGLYTNPENKGLHLIANTLSVKYPVISVNSIVGMRTDDSG
jgi:hypothetical protein